MGIGNVSAADPWGNGVLFRATGGVSVLVVMRHKGLGRGLETLLEKSSTPSCHSQPGRSGVQLFLERQPELMTPTEPERQVMGKRIEILAYVLWVVDGILVVLAFVLLSSPAVGRGMVLGIGSTLIAVGAVVGFCGLLIETVRRQLFE